MRVRRLLLLGALALAACRHGGAESVRPVDRAKRVHRDAVVFDAHCDTLLRIADEGLDLGRRARDGHVDLVRMAEGGVDVQVFAVYVEPRDLKRARSRAFELLDVIHAELARHPKRIALARTVEQALRIVRQGRIAAFLGLEGGYALEDDPAVLKLLHDRGVRYMTLTWRFNTSWADGSEDTPRHGGLTPLGRRIVQEMNRLKMVVDVSHVSDATFRDVLETTTQPVIASHSNARALTNHVRNLSDEMLRAVAKNGGVVGVSFAAAFLDEKFRSRGAALIEQMKPEIERAKDCHDTPARCRDRMKQLYRRIASQLPRVSIERVIDHIDHVARVAGIDHVGLGSDFDGYTTGPAELSDCSRLPLITERLLARGYSQRDVKKILGDNFLRVFRAVIGR
jgi:membrane dipeptidase